MKYVIMPLFKGLCITFRLLIAILMFIIQSIVAFLFVLWDFSFKLPKNFWVVDNYSRTEKLKALLSGIPYQIYEYPTSFHWALFYNNKKYLTEKA